jgi:hypothetical protein
MDGSFVKGALIGGLGAAYFDVVTRKYDGSRADVDFALLVPAVAPHL